MPARRYVACAFAFCILIGCASRARHSVPRSATLTDVVALESAHGYPAWAQEDALMTEFQLEFDNRKLIDGILTFTTDGTKSRLDLRNGTRLVRSGADCWVSPDTSRLTPADAASHLHTWPFFVAAPMRLRAPGAQLRWANQQPLGDEGKRYPAVGLTHHDAGDWFILYRDPETDRLKAIAYVIRPADAPPTAPAPDPRAIVYDDVRAVANTAVALATRWTFYDWVPGRGVAGDPIGRATLRNTHFVRPPPGFFDPPVDAR